MSFFAARKIRYLSALSLLFLSGFVRSEAVAQETFDAARFQPVSASRPGARLLVSPQGGAMDFTTGDFVEVALPVDEYGRPGIVRSLELAFLDSPWLDIEVLGRAVPGGSTTSFGVLEFGNPSQLISLSAPTRLASLRLEVRHNRLVRIPVLASLRVLALATTRILEIEGHGWYRQAPPPGAWTSFALRIRNTWEDDFGLLFASVGQPVLASPIALLPAARGGLLLDPSSTSLLEARPLTGGSWYFVVSFPFEPALLSAPIHLQALLGEGLATPQALQLFWTRPVTIYT